jgi:hypothetical protein
MLEPLEWAKPTSSSIPAQAGIQTKEKSLCISLLPIITGGRDCHALKGSQW